MKTTRKTAIITGAGGGLGEALAIEFAKKDYDLALVDIDSKGLSKVKEKVRTPKNFVSTHIADVSYPSQVEKTVRSVGKQHGRIDVLVNNAGIYIAAPFSQLDLNDFKKVMDVNFMGTVYFTKYALPILKKSDSPSVINICSDFGLIGFPNKIAYSSSKAAMRGFTNCLWTEEGDKNLNVMIVYPPAIDTGLIKNAKFWKIEKRTLEFEFVRKNSFSAELVAKRILDGMDKRKKVLRIGFTIRMIDIASRYFPETTHKILTKLKNRFDFV
ncbi:SDR family NAD(P)-dependent oxidoreductase [Leptospira licerasiae]|uniref:KR domain protein n=1 Tax=Leptospira licerasiae str. MMD4847 TaxID=1049971 RepID=A0ABP2RAD6_9LEPT|nr:SDR family oxidoreductase [Leptospira licerasiae]EID99695.1 KR domain protein [Leptospira licerasiae serovar Varillal str. VAR 010]EJZ41490.1 KR domain protein [Leptospira licerasiae str. MMD4847]